MYAAKLRLVYELKKQIEDFEDSFLNIDEIQEHIRKTNDKLGIVDQLEKEKQITG